jgi:TPR repeat protein
VLFISYAGLGLLVFVFGIVAAAIGIWAGANRLISRTAATYLIFTIWALACFLFGSWVNSRKKDRVLVDPTTHEEVVLKTRHSLYGIHIEYWAFIILMIAAIFFYADVQSGKIELKGFVPWAENEHTSPASPNDDFETGFQFYKDKKYKEALAAFSRSADRGETGGQFFTGFMLLKGLGVDQDDTKALGWFRKAADQGDTKSQDIIGSFYEDGRVVQRDYQKAIEWYSRAANAGYSVAQYDLGMLYLNGKGRDKNPAEAMKWLGKAAAQGDEDAKKVLAESQSAANDVSAVSSADISPRYVPGKINIVFKDAVPGAFENGRALSCALIANIHNNTKYHLNKVSFKIKDWSFNFDDEMNANTYVDDYPIAEISLSNGTVCSNQAAYIKQAIETAAIFDCSMPGVAEGDCQDLVAISNIMDDAGVERISKAEMALGAKQTAPLHEAIVKAGLDKPVVGPMTSERQAKFANLLDTFVAIDSKSWSLNKYNIGSMRTVSVVSQSPDGSAIQLEGYYSYRARNCHLAGLSPRSRTAL